MTDIKNRLRALNRLETPDLWLRATSLEPPPMVDEPIPSRMRRVAAGVVAFAVFAAAGAFAWQALRPAGPTPPLNATSTTSSTPAQPAGATEVAPLPGIPGFLVAGPDAVYVAIASGDNQRVAVARFDPQTGSVTTSDWQAGSDIRQGTLAVAGGSVWFAAQDPVDKQASDALYRFDADTLTILPSVTMDAPPTTVASSAAGLWVGAGSELVLIDPSTGATLRTGSIQGSITHIALDPAGARLYVAATPSSDTARQGILLELDPTNGSLIASAELGDASLGGVSAIAPTDDGVWAATPTGMAATLQFLGASDLKTTATYQQSATNGVQVSITSGVLWVNTVGGMVCADPATGDVRDTLAVGNGDWLTTNVVATTSGLYATNGGSLFSLVPPASCGIAS